MTLDNMAPVKLELSLTRGVKVFASRLWLSLMYNGYRQQWPSKGNQMECREASKLNFSHQGVAYCHGNRINRHIGHSVCGLQHVPKHVTSNFKCVKF